HAKGVFPETSANRQDGIILWEVGQVILTVAEGGPGQVPGNFPQVGLHDLLNGGLGFRVLGQDDLSDNGIHISVRELNADGETALKLFQVTGAGNGGLTGTNEQELATKVLAARFHHFLYGDGTLAVLANELLNFVQNDQRQREFALLCQSLANGLEHVVTGDVLNVRVQVVQGFDARRW